MKKALYMLAEFSDRDFDWLLGAGRKTKVLAGNVLIREGEPTDALYLIVSGTLAVSVDALGGEEIARLGDGEVVGEMSFVDARPPSATVRAIEDSLVWSVPRSKLAAKLGQDIEFAAHFYHAIAAFLTDRMRHTVGLLGYTEQPSLTEDELNPQVLGNINLANARLKWLLNHI